MDAHDDPQWLRVMAFAAAAAVAAFGSIGLLLAVLGWYSRPAVFAGGVVVFAGLGWLARPLLPRRGDVSRSAHVVGVLAVVAITAITVWNVSNTSHQVLVIRDGGTYLNAGKWISGHGTLEVDAFQGPFTQSTGLAASSAGMSRDGDHLDFTLGHLFPVLLAEAQGLGGDGLMFATVGLLGGAALLAFYVLARRVLPHPLAALGATICLGLLMPQASFSRDSTTEIPMQVLLFTAAWLLCDPRTLENVGPAFVAGFFLGLLQAVHIDGLAFVVGLPFVALGAWWSARASAGRRVLRALVGLTVGLALGVALGFFDLTQRASHYLRSLRFDVQRLTGALIAAIVVAVVLALVARWWSGRGETAGERLHRPRGPGAWVAGALVLVAGFGAWLVRPSLQTVRSGRPSEIVGLVQRATHIKFDPTRRYFEHSVEWVGWYIGPITLTLAVLGLAYVAWSFVRGELAWPARVATLLLVPPSLLYLWRPSITPDQIWVMRRFVPAILPMFVLAAFGAMSVVAARRPFGSALGAAPVRRAIAIVLGVAAVAFPLYAIRNVASMTQQHGFDVAVKKVCKRIGPHAAVVVPQEPAPLTWYLDPQTLRSFCDVPVAIIGSGQRSAVAPTVGGGQFGAAALRDLARQWASQHRDLYVVAGTPNTVRRFVPGARPRVILAKPGRHLLEQTLVTRPNTYQPERVGFVVARVPVA